MYSLDEVKKVDPEVAQAIIDEENRQNSHIELTTRGEKLGFVGRQEGMVAQAVVLLRKKGV